MIQVWCHFFIFVSLNSIQKFTSSPCQEEAVPGTENLTAPLPLGSNGQGAVGSMGSTNAGCDIANMVQLWPFISYKYL